MRVTYVVPRYGLEIVGGAESAARLFAEGLVARAGWDVDVLTTCALDASTWVDAYEPGEVDINGVRVRRFRSMDLSAGGIRRSGWIMSIRLMGVESVLVSRTQGWVLTPIWPMRLRLVKC